MLEPFLIQILILFFTMYSFKKIEYYILKPLGVIIMSMPVIECNNVDKCCAASSLLLSIALEETAISHILNAEGEKLQKVIGSCNPSIDDLIEINSSVESMIDKITSLEIILKSKIDTIKPILDECHNKKPHKKEC